MEDKSQRDLEQRVLELEEKVRKLEQKVLGTQAQQNKLEQSAKLVHDNLTKNPYTLKREEVQSSPSLEQDLKQEKVLKKKIGEAEIGKYFIGVLAAILIFIGAGSFISLIWSSLSDAVRLGLISSIGILLTVLGFYLINKSKNPISSLVLGTGAGLIFISILSSNIFFHFIGDITAIILIGIWAIFFILSYKYTKMFFTTVIAYIGSIVALLLGVTLVQNSIEFIVLMLYVTSISSVLIITSHKWLNEEKKIISILLAMLSYAILLVGGLDKESVEIVLFVMMFIEYILFNYLYYKVEKIGKNKLWYLFINAVMSIITLMFLNKVCPQVGADISLILAWFFAINLVQMIILEFWTKNVRRMNITYYVVIQVVSAIIYNMYKFNTVAGISVVGIILLIFQLLNRHKGYKLLISLIAIIDSILLCIMGRNSDIILLSVFYAVLQLITITFVVYDTYKHNDSNSKNLVNKFLKIVSLLVYTINAYYIPYMSMGAFAHSRYAGNSAMLSSYIDLVVPYMFLSIALCIIVGSGYLKDWKSDKFRWFTKNEGVSQDITIILFYIITSIAYIAGLKLITMPDIWYEQLIVILSVLAVALLQSKNLIDNYKDKPFIGGWIGLKYFILTWVIMRSVWNVNIESVIMSVAGLVISLLSIVAGFKIKMKSLRLYGLIVTILMVLKFIFVDLGQENSITRIVALLLGGLICFGITLLYNKLNKEIESN